MGQARPFFGVDAFGCLRLLRVLIPHLIGVNCMQQGGSDDYPRR